MTGFRGRLAAWRGSNPAVAEVAVGVGAGALVLVIALWQWGTTGDALLRGLTLGLWLGLVVWLVARRRRAVEERALTRAEADRAALRLELARELHDTLAGEVAAIGIQAAAGRRVLATQPSEAEAALERIEVASRAANADLRRMLEALRSDDGASLAAAPGLSALPALADEQVLGRAGAVAVAVDPAVATSIDAALDRAAYRIVEEAVRNARRHAGPVPVTVTVSIDGPDLRLVVINGPRHAAGDRAAGPGSGLGLVGMRERAAVFGGSVDAGPTDDGGFRVDARLPVSAGTTGASA